MTREELFKFAETEMNTAHPTGRHYGDLSDILAALQKGPDND